MTEAIKIDGLNEFVRNLKKLDADLPKTLRVGFNDAAQIIVDYAKPKVPHKSGRAAGSTGPRKRSASSSPVAYGCGTPARRTCHMTRSRR